MASREQRAATDGWRDMAERQHWSADSNEPPLLQWVRLVTTVTVFWGATPQAVMDTDVSQ